MNTPGFFEEYYITGCKCVYISCEQIISKLGFVSQIEFKWTEMVKLFLNTL